MKHLTIAGAILGGLITTPVPALAQNWTVTSAPNTNWSCVACSADGSKLVATVDGGLIYTSTNSGATWLAASAPATNWSGVATSADGAGLLAASQSALYVSSDSGANWAVAFTGGDWKTALSSADGTVLTAWGSGVVCFSTNSGVAWTQEAWALPTGVRYTALACSAGGKTLAMAQQDAMIGPGSAGVLFFADTGTNLMFEYGTPNSLARGQFTAIALSADGAKLSALCSNPSAPGCPGQFWHSPDSGLTWMSNCISASTLIALACSADGTRLAAAGTGDAIYTSTNSGVTWSPATVPTGNWCAVASSADGTKLAAVANGGGICTWQTTPAPALTIAPVGNGLVISWVIPSTDFVLQQNSGFDPSNWTDVVPPPALNLTNLQNQVTIAMPSGTTFYRLKGLVRH